MAKEQKLNLIEELTTYKNDYKIWPLDPPKARPDLRLREEPPIKQRPPFVRIDFQSHAPFLSSVHVPFDMYLAPKPIIETDPRECFQIHQPSESTGVDKRIQLPTILPPAVPVEKITDERALHTILYFTYNSTQKILMKEAALKITRGPNPPNRVVVEDPELQYKSELYPPLPRGWIAAAKHWDCLQSRSLGDPTRTFWEKRGAEMECSHKKEFPSQEMKDEIERLVLENKLRLPYTVFKTGYGGYMPMVAKGVPLEKN